MILMLIFMVVPVNADDYRDGVEAHKRGDYKTAFEKWKPLAEQGYVNSQNNYHRCIDSRR